MGINIPRASQAALGVKNPPARAGDVRRVGFIPVSGSSPGGGCGHPLQYSCLENPHGQRSLAGYSPWGCFGHVQLFATPWTVACQAPLSIGFSRQGYWSGWPHPPPGDLPNSGIKPGSHMSPALTGRFFTTSATCEALS